METKKRNHIIVDKVPVLAAIILMIIGIALPSLIANPIASAFGGETAAGTIVRGIAAILVSLVMMGLYILWFRPEFKANLGSEGLKEGLMVLIPFLIVWTVYYILKGLYGSVFHFHSSGI